MSDIDKLAELLLINKLTISVAESCTAGALSAKLTSISGSSKYFDRGYITYSNKAKREVLGVSSNTLDKYGAVSKQVVLEMLNGIVNNSRTQLAVAISGIAGPTGGSLNKPVGTVYLAFLTAKKKYAIKKLFYGNRKMIIKQSVDFAINNLITNISKCF